MGGYSFAIYELVTETLLSKLKEVYNKLSMKIGIYNKIIDNMEKTRDSMEISKNRIQSINNKIKEIEYLYNQRFNNQIDNDV